MITPVLPATWAVPPSASSSSLKSSKSATLLPAGASYFSHLRLIHTHAGSFSAFDAAESSNSKNGNGNAAEGDEFGEEMRGVGEEEESSELLALDPKEWKKHDFYAVLGLGQWRWKTTPEMIKVAREYPLYLTLSNADDKFV